MDGPTQSLLRPLRNLPTSPDFPEPLLPVLSPGWEEPQGDGDSLTAATTDSVNDSVLRARGSCTGRQPEITVCTPRGDASRAPPPSTHGWCTGDPGGPCAGGGAVSLGGGARLHVNIVL